MAVQNFFVQDGLNVNNFITANSTTLKVGTNTFINSTAIRIGNAVGFALGANGDSLGSNGFYLTSNGTTVFWSTVAGGAPNTAAAFAWTNTHSFAGNVTITSTAFLSANGTVGTNGQFLASNGTTVYWATPSASATAGGPNTAIQYANGTNIVGNGNFTYDYIIGKFRTGLGSGFALSNNTIVEIDNNGNNYIEVNIQNANTGNNSSSDYSATADSGNDSIDFINMGINGSTYNQASQNIVGAKDGYLYTSNGHLAIAVQAAKEIRFAANGLTSTNEILSINSAAIQISNGVQLWANNSAGTSGQVLSSNGSGVYWGTAAAGGISGAQLMTSFNQAWF